MQPAFLPWLGYFDRIAKSDIHIILNNVPMDGSSKTRFTNRNKIRTHNGWCWLTVPVKATKRSNRVSIDRLQINYEEPWQRKHLKAIENNYSKAPYFDNYISFVRDIYEYKHESFNNLLLESTAQFFKIIGIDKPYILSSDMDVTSSKDELILELCKKVQATEYISGPFGRDYLDLKSFHDEGISLTFHDYTHPQYKQVFNGFEPYMSIIDLLFNHGPRTLEMLSTSNSLS